MKRLVIVPCGLDEANAFIVQHHRHHGPVVGHKFSLAVAAGELLDLDHPYRVVGVAIVGRPVSQRLDNGLTLEVTRCCTDGTKDAASMLYGACRRAVFALGYRKLITYTLKSEVGSSLRGAGFKVIGEVIGRSWSVPSRPRVDKHPLQDKLRWEVTA